MVLGRIDLAYRNSTALTPPCPSRSMPPAAKPLLAITMGDPAGIGPEVIVGALADSTVYERVRPMVVGHPEILCRAARLLRRQIDIVEIASPEEARALSADAS